MNDQRDLDALIGSALHARADQLTEADLRPSGAPVTSRMPRARWGVPLLAAAAVVALAVGSTVLVRTLSSPASHSPSGASPVSPVSSAVTSPLTASTSASVSPSATASASMSRTAKSSGTAAGPGPQYNLGYQPLWPFGDYAQAADWLAAYRAQGSQPWHRDPGLTAVAFTRDYLGFTELNSTTSSRIDATGAHIGVGYLDPNGKLHTAAVLHLVRFGNSTDSPWEVVGSDDTTFSLELPAYGSAVRSPMTVGGHLTGVDESIRLSVRSLTGGLVSAPLPGIPAGGVNQAWRGSLTFTGRGVLTIVAATGGHLKAVERFAIQGVHT